MSRKYPGNAINGQKISGHCPVNFREEMSRTFPANVQEMSKEIVGHVRETFRKCPGKDLKNQDLSGKGPGICRNLPGSCQELQGNFRNLSGNVPVVVQKISWKIWIRFCLHVWICVDMFLSGEKGPAGPPTQSILSTRAIPIQYWFEFLTGLLGLFSGV